MARMNGFAKLGSKREIEQEKENLWSIQSNGAEIATLLVNPLYWVTIVGREYPGIYIELADLTLHPDISIVFSYPYGDSDYARRSDYYIVEGISTTNFITVRAPHRLADNTRDEVLRQIQDRKLLPGVCRLPTQSSLAETTGKLKIAIRPREGLAYFHFELTPDAANYATPAEQLNQAAYNVYTIATNPQALFETLNVKVMNGHYEVFVYDYDRKDPDFVQAPDNSIGVRFGGIDSTPQPPTVRGKTDEAVSKSDPDPPQCTASQLQLIVLANANGSLSCMCAKGQGTVYCVEQAGECVVYCMSTTVVGVACYN